MLKVIETVENDLIVDDDGLVVYWPEPIKSASGLTADNLREIADEIDRRNNQCGERGENSN